MLSLFALQCIEAPLEPIAPTSDIQLNIPLLDLTRYVGDLFSKDTSTVKQDAQGGYYFADTQAGEPTPIDTIKVAPAPTAQQVEVGKIGVDGIPPTGSSITAGDLGLTTGTLPFMPAQTIPLTPLSLSASSQFDYVAVDTGSLTLKIVNNFPFPIDFPLPIVLRNNSTIPQDTSTVAVFAIPGVMNSGDTRIVNSDLSGKIMRGDLRTDSIKVHTSGMSSSFTINSTDGIAFEFRSSSLLADSAKAIIPSQSVYSVNDSTFSIDDSVVVSSAHFRGGSFTVAIINQLDINVGVYLKFDEFKSTNPPNSSFQIDINLAGKDSLVRTIRMDTLQILSLPRSLGTQLTYSVGIKTINSEGAKKTVTSKDFVRAEIRPGNEFQLKDITGKIKPTTVFINSRAPGMNIGEAAEKFSASYTFDSVKIALNLGLTGGYPTAYDLTFIAKNNKTGITASMPIPAPLGDSIKIFYPGGNRMTQIVLDNSQGLSAFLQKFVPYFPDSFIVIGSVTLNPNFEQHTIADTAKIYQMVDVYFPMKVGIKDGKLIEVAELSGDNFPKDFSKSIKETGLNFEFTNRMPISLQFKAALMGRLTPFSNYDTLLILPTDNIPRIIQPAAVDANGSAISSQRSTFAYILTGTDVEKFNLADSIVIRLDVVTSTPTGVTPGTRAVRMRASDWLRVRASGKMTYIINKPE